MSPHRAVPDRLVPLLTRLALAGEWDQPAMTHRWAPTLGVEPAAELARRLLELASEPPRPQEGGTDSSAALARLLGDLPALPLRSEPVLSSPRPGLPHFWRFGVPPWQTSAELAAALDLAVGELEWFADPGHWLRGAREPLQHYRSHRQPTAHGGHRLIEAPKPRLRELQRRLLRRVLRLVPNHPLVHGFVPHRSALTAARVHQGNPVLLRADLAQFFASVHAGRVRGVFTALGYPPRVAAALTGLCTTRTPTAVLRVVPAAERARLRGGHLPQGAPTSPVLANLVLHRMDRRLAGLAAAHGCVVTRYADDLALSGPADTDCGALVFALSRLVADEGFRLHPHKTTVARAHTRQQLLGLVVNDRAGVSRRERDELRAVLHNCAVTGPQAQNHRQLPDFRAHLEGRIAWAGAGHPARRDRLRRMLEAIEW